MNVELFLTTEGWHKSGPDFYYPDTDYPHIHLNLNHKNSSGKYWSTSDVGSGQGFAAVKAAYASIASWVNFVACSRGPDNGGATNLISGGKKTAKLRDTMNILLEEVKKFDEQDVAVDRLSPIRNKLYYILLPFDFVL